MTTAWKSRQFGSKEDWLTPPEFRESFGEFDLDPCCPPNMPWKTAKMMLTPAENGLKTPWSGRVWLNPPYGFKVVQWMKLMSQHRNGIVLVPPRIETKWFHAYVWPVADAFLAPSKRVQFYQWRPDGEPIKMMANNVAPSIVIAYGQQNADCLARAALDGLGWYLDNTYSKIIQG